MKSSLLRLLATIAALAVLLPSRAMGFFREA